jgi:hypothetical protein
MQDHNPSNYISKQDGSDKVIDAPHCTSGDDVDQFVISNGRGFLPNQSHLPSFHPVLQRSSQKRQSNSFFPSFRLTALCASHIQVPNSERPESRGSLRPPDWFIQARKSSAQTQHGYKREKSFRKECISNCCSDVALGG